MFFSFHFAKHAALALAFASTALSYSQTLEVTLTPSNYNGYNVSCFGAQDGTISASVSGGTAPYSYDWSTGSNADNIADLSAGYYRVKIADAMGDAVEAEITLTEPQSMKVTATPHAFSNGYNISCYECSNGSIQLAVAHGVPPYSFLWDDGSTNQNRWALDQGTYKVTVSDANGCESLQADAYISRPERSDWTMGGNAGTDPGTDFIGTTDAQDVVFRSNGGERLRLLSGGEVKVNSLIGGNSGVLMADENGILKRLGPGGPVVPVGLCYYLESKPYWETRGNDFTQLCPEENPVLGTLSNHHLKLVANGQQHMIITTGGKVGIGTTPPAAGSAVNGYRLYVDDGIATRDVLVKLGAWPDYVFGADYDLMPMRDLRGFLQENHHLPGIPSAAEVDEKGGVEVGDLQKRMLEVVEQQALYILQLEERMALLEQRLATLQTSK
ncbi:MAG: SprB repeat-containing protein [Flavobacteriales bacterium]|nr:SprB repeat-containing protein [Flavobacteriales bacterium]